MLDLLTDLMAVADGRCTYAEARHVDTRAETLAVRGGRIDTIDATTSEGIGVRVRVGGAWGFAATDRLDREGAEAALAQALAIAQAQPAAATTALAPVAPARGHWSSACDVDPFSVSLEAKLALLFAAEEALHTGDPRLVRTEAGARAWRERKAFASTEGAACTQEQVACGAGIAAYAGDGADVQVRSYPLSHGGFFAAAGWEHVDRLALTGQGARVASEAVALLTAPPCPEGRRTNVLHGEQVALQVHESIGHALELDRIQLGEASYAGTSWVQPGDIGAGLRYGSEHLNITADATLPGGLGSFGWDDEGVPATRTPLIERGELRAALSNRESAAALGLGASGGCARADGFARQPIVRMTNVSLEPGAIDTFVIRTMGWRAKPSARAQPAEAPRPCADADWRSESAASSVPSEMRVVRPPATPSSSQPNDPSAPGSVASATTVRCSDP